MLDIYEGIRTSITGADINNDSLIDIIIGNYCGGVAYYKGDTAGITTGILNPVEEQNNTTLLYPNPASNELNISFAQTLNETIEVQVFNLTGQLLYRNSIQKGQQLVNINISSFPSGIYVLTAKEKNYSEVKKFVVSKF